MTDTPTEAAHNLNADPEALAWARADGHLCELVVIKELAHA